jgi:hypothetical protein
MPAPISVTVDALGNPTCAPGTYDVGKSKGTVVIHWRMDTQGYKVSGVTGLPASEFIDSASNGNTGWKVTDKNNVVGDYSYTIQVTSIPQGTKTELDPIIRNGGQE